jgi:hypothetical protein
MEHAWEGRECIQNFVQKSEGIPDGKPRYRWKDNIKMDLKNRVLGCGLDSCGLG